MRYTSPARAAAALVLALFSVRAAAAAIAPAFSASPEGKPEHVLLVILDGLSFKAWEKADIPALRRLRERGSVVEQVFLPPAAHPRVGPYARIHTCSIPNPIMMAGTIFIDEKTEYVASRLYPGRITAFVADALGYESLTRDYHLLYQKTGPDSEAVDAALGFLERYRPAFLRLHLQQTGEAGSRVMNAAAAAPWKSDIWHPESPYRASLEQAAAEIGRLADRIEALGWMDRTAIMVLGDHGQADTGWHPLELPESSITTLVVAGAGVKSGIRLPYGELVDVAPTICRLLGVEPPATSRGRVLAEALTDWSGPPPPRPETQKKLNTPVQ